MAYSLETSSVKTIVPGAEVSGFADVVARARTNELGSSATMLSGAIDYVSGHAGGHTYTGIAPIQVNNTSDEISITGESLSAGPGIDMFSSGGYVNICTTGKEISAGPGIDIFSSGEYFVISAAGAGFPMSSNDGTRNYQMDINSSAMYITTATGAAGATTKLTTPGVQYEAYPATDVSASWKDMINAANNRSNCYCVSLNSTNTAVDLEDLSAYDRITVLHAQEYVGDDYYIRWNNNTRTVHSGEYIEMAKVKYNGNTVWTFLNSGWYDDNEWD